MPPVFSFYLLFSDPIYAGQNTVPSTIIQNLTAVSSNIAYSNHVTDNLTVLSSRYTATDNGVLQGLLYVPDLLDDDPCVEYERDYVPDSAVRQIDLPATNYNLIAIAPWFNSSCTKSYLYSARYDPLRAFIFYVPSNDSTKPPGPGAPDWDLEDNGLWQTTNHYPIFAVPGAFGSEMMYQLSLYSGNVTNVPFGDNISELYNPDPHDYIRIWTELTVHTPTGLPGVWVFILAVVGVLLAVIALTTLSMHIVWRRRRLSLQRRIMAGSINLEAMGIKRLAVPAHHIQTFPLFTYSYEPPPSRSPAPSPSPPLISLPSLPLLSPPSPSPSPTSPLPPSPPPGPHAPPPSSISTTARAAASPVSAVTFSVPDSQRASRRSQLHQSLDAAVDSDTLSAAAADAQRSSPSEKGSRSASAMTSPSKLVSLVSAGGDLDYQPACHICLENFQNRVTIIRELPCGHIFHPDCIDEFLSQMSSLCPLCKASMLPKGYCPPNITNAIVRRERAIRRLRERIDVDDPDVEYVSEPRRSWSMSVKKRMHGATHRLSLSRSFDTAAGRQAGIELKTLSDSAQRQPNSRQHGLPTSEATRIRMQQLAGANAGESRTPTPTCK
ncbi:ring finger domain protein [Niveomyces insectorum RCEF 264]|uniref:Ring finger domain protein n=1 Tax=Niveomyces insectorum RCEF 264 TaxID=1081102 RepID=A0A167VIN1_9HYPO|nr:ring finger domain protein [Niveomyces insectorum RCEF 264]